MTQEIIKKSSWLMVNITKSNCAVLAVSMTQRSKEMDEVAALYPDKMYRYVYRFWTKEEKAVFFRDLLEKYNLITYVKNSNWSGSLDVIVKEDFIVRAYKEWGAFDTATPNDVWIPDYKAWHALYNHRCSFDGLIGKNDEAVLYIGKFAREAPGDNPVPKWFSPYISANDSTYIKSKKEAIKAYMNEKWDAYEAARKALVDIEKAHE